MGLLAALRAFQCVQNLIADIHARPRLMLARESSRILDVADDAGVLEVELRSEIELDRHNRAKRERSGKFLPWPGARELASRGSAGTIRMPECRPAEHPRHA